MQNIANGIEFEDPSASSHTFRAELNSFVMENTGALHAFFRKLTVGCHLCFLTLVKEDQDDRVESSQPFLCLPNGAAQLALETLAETLKANHDAIYNKLTKAENKKVV